MTRETGLRFAGYLPRLDASGDDGTGLLALSNGQNPLLAVLGAIVGLPGAAWTGVRRSLERFIELRRPTREANWQMLCPESDSLRISDI